MLSAPYNNSAQAFYRFSIMSSCSPSLLGLSLSIRCSCRQPQMMNHTLRVMPTGQTCVFCG